MSLLSFLKREQAPATPIAVEPADPQWRRDKRGYFHRLLWLKPAEQGLSGMGGVFVIWHRGVRPEWVTIGTTDDLAAALSAARDEPEIARYEMNGGLYVTWSPIDGKFRDGVAAYLIDLLNPVAQVPLAGVSVDTDAKHIPVLPPK